MASETPSEMDAVSVARSYLASYALLDYERMAAHTTDDFVFEDPAFPHLEGNHARGMFKMFITGASKNNMKIIVVDVQPSKADPLNLVDAKYDAVYTFGERPVTNHISTVITVSQGKVSKQVDSFDFAAWASQAVGFMGWLFGSTSFLQHQVQSKAKARLDSFMVKDAAGKISSK